MSLGSTYELIAPASITQSGWIGSGYIITDPATGAGAYKIRYLGKISILAKSAVFFVIAVTDVGSAT